jgi:hypothetical protein
MQKDQTTSNTNSTAELPTGFSTGRLAEQHERPAELAQLNVFIGRWMTEGETVAGPGASAVAIVASDVYQWLPGEHFIMHPAYGRIGAMGVGGIEIIGFDPETREFQTHFFDSQGNTTRQTLTCRDNIWIWEGGDARCTGIFTDNGETLTARHERSDDGVNWVPSMNVVLRKID